MAGGAAPALYPVLAAVMGYNSSSATPSHVISLPASSPGDLLILQTSSVGSSTLTPPAGWTVLANVTPGTTARGVWAYRVGQIGDPTSIIVGQSSAVRMSAQIAKISAGSFRDVPEIATASGSSTTARYSPSLAASWGVGHNLWIAFLSTNSNPSVTTFPYINNNNEQASTGGSSALCTKESTAGTENPGAWATSANYAWASATVVVRGA